MSLPGIRFGQEQPPLTDFLKNVLERYSDGGQILKELIQNADDAGASEVKIVFDATSYGTTSLFSPSLALFQGPALYCYNNAEFTDKDWEGLKNVMRSSKEDNPLKVGRFGIGFNSVYHITDLPSVVSGGRVAFLDPHEKYFVSGESGRAFFTKDESLKENFDQFSPFQHEIFHCNFLRENYYRGTLFRFPLRTEPSKLSNKIYTREMVNTLLDSLKKEASAILLFLKNIESISLYEREEGGEFIRLYTVKVSEESKIEVRKRRRELIQDITVEWNFAVKTNFFRLEIERESPGKPPEKDEWFLANQVGTNENELIELARDLKLLPWIGIAFLLDANNNMSSLGRIFCFLPLPPDGDCRTGLPVQVNGYFGLTDNRRALKWPGPDCQNDDTARWNELLLRNIGSRVYANLIINIARESSGNVQPKKLAELVYTALPNLSRVRSNWKCITEPLVKTVLARESEIFLATPKGICRWVNLGTAIIDRLDESKDMREEIKQVVLKTLLNAGRPIVSLPEHVIQIIDQYHQMSGWKTLQKVTPELLCIVLRSNSNNFYDSDDRLSMLEYALQTVPRNIHGLRGVPLLPLENRQFIKFSKVSDEKIYILSEKVSVDLLPNMKHRLLYRNLSQPVQQKLSEVAFTKQTQLHHATNHDIIELLRQNLPKDWSTSSAQQLETVTWNPEIEQHPSLAWLKLMWKWIKKNYPTDLCEFKEMPLIPVSTSTPTSLARLQQNSTIIAREFESRRYHEVLSGVMCEFLKSSGCIVVDKLPSFVKHERIFDYVALPNPSGILNLFLRAGKKIVQQLPQSSREGKQELCCILSKLDLLDSNHKSVISSLPIFETVDGNDFLNCRSKQDGPRLVAPRNFELPEGMQLVDRAKILSSSKDENHRLLGKLGMKIESMASLIMARLENFLINSKIMKEEKNELMLWILEEMDILNREEPDFVSFISQLACIPTASGKRVPPNQLFDDSDALLTELLQDNHKAFPTGLFSEPVRRRRRKLKVRGWENLTFKDILFVVNRTSGLCLGQGKALLEIINKRPKLLEEKTSDGRLLKNVLRKVPWLPRVVDRPINYPDFMPWYGGMSLCKPDGMFPDSMAFLVGATRPVFDENLVASEVQKLLFDTPGAHDAPPQDVVKQLHVAIACWTNLTTKQRIRMSVAKFEEMIAVIYAHLSTAPQSSVQHLLQSKGLTHWVWHGSGFTSPEKVAFESPFPKSINLHPYLFLLPQAEISQVDDFLLSLGVKPQFNVDDLLVMLSIIKEKHDNEEKPREDAMQDLDQCRAVLEWIVTISGKLSDERRSNLLIPVQTSSGKLQLEPCNRCTYCDREFLRQGASEFEASTNSYLIHKAIPDDLAVRLRVPRLSSCLAGAKAVGIEFKEAGQYEPLTTRIRNILQQYKEGMPIFKEIIQNADDARASKVFFVVDWRENPCEQLLTEELAECQGPALWAYNDAKFSEADFENINKLAGDTKKEDLHKVGRFGLGFNSVYHLTDVPSFVSGEHFVVFDPNMTHISELIKGKKRKGGFMLNLVESSLALSRFPDQFMPYHQMFGFDMKGTEPFHFEGTLFRLPFRTAKQAEESEISKDPYTRENVEDLIKSLKESASTLLLFTQNVKEVQVFEIPTNSNVNKCFEKPLMSVTKSIVNILDTNEADNHGEGTILENSSTWLKNIGGSEMEVTSEGPRRTEELRMKVTMVKSGLSESKVVETSEETWLVNSCAGVRSSLEVARSPKGEKKAVVPLSGIAAKIAYSDAGSLKILPVEAGEVFCFMPLSIESGFPVHVNGCFSMYSNRRHLWEKAVGESQSIKPFEVEWNEALMKDSLVQAYLQLLKELTNKNAEQYEFHTLWPNPAKMNYPKALKPFLLSFFKTIIDEEWQLFYCNGKWKKLDECRILDPELAKVDESVIIMNQLNENVLSLPQDFIEAFKSSGKETFTFIEAHMLTEDIFLKDFFFPNLSRISIHDRNSVLVHILDCRPNEKGEYDDLLCSYQGFSCSVDGTVLRKPNELVHPKGNVACLFSEEEKRFPLDDRFLTKERAMMLEELGMTVDFLPWSSLCERAEWISNHCDAARARFLIQYLNQTPPKDEITPDEMERLRAARFLPILSKPKDLPFPWKSEKIPGTELAAANDLFPEIHKHLVGSSQLILDESSHLQSVPDRNLKKILGFDLKQPQLSDVITQLDHIVQLSNLLTREDKEVMCSTIYEFLQEVVTTENLTSQQSYLREQLSSRSWMLVEGRMVYPEHVARNWKKENGSPYLFPLPLGYQAKFKGLIDWYGVKENFSLGEFTEAIHKLQQDNDGKELTDDEIRNFNVLLEEVVFKSPEERPKDPLPLPSQDCQLHYGNELVINDTPWLEVDVANVKFVHEMVPANLVYKCGAKQLRSKVVEEISKPIGQPHGQHEKLTIRLKNILETFPADEGILKELLKNADDAKASEIHFVFDPRTHHNKRIFSENWNALQGPAICVYTNKPFSEEDIEGIKKLGLGSKVDDLAEKTYGIGFKAVYHLTDCPYFISNDEIIGVSDPHTAYIPGASEEKPGRVFRNLDQVFRKNFQDVLSGFLGDFFVLEGGTMFRFPLRRDTNLHSEICTTQWDGKSVKELLDRFRESAKDMLLFLSNITRISVSEIEDGKLKTYFANCDVSDVDKRTKLFEKIKEYQKVPTPEIPLQAIHYITKISDTSGVRSDWLVTQYLGSESRDRNYQVPNGMTMGLLPRAGIAVRLPTAVSDSTTTPQFRYSLFCMLPLQVYLKFPVQISGDFALNPSRRDVWYDPKSSDERDAWNDFMKRHVIAPAYASAIGHAKNHIPGYESESDTSGTFSSKKEAEDGLAWYHQLFPSIEDLDAAWKPVGEELYKNFLSTFAVLPVALSVSDSKKPEDELNKDTSESRTEEDQTPVKVTWCKVSDVYFRISGMSPELEKTLLDIGFHLLLDTPSKIVESFKAVGYNRNVSPEHVISFLRKHEESKGNLPRGIKDTFLRDVNTVHELTTYCSDAENFFKSLEGVPLLLTQDGILRCFQSNSTVFCSKFYELVPSRPDLFLCDLLQRHYESRTNECSNVMREFLIPDLAKFHTDLFPPAWLTSISAQQWNPSVQDDTFPSKEWLVLLWEFIDTVSKGKSGEDCQRKMSDFLNEIADWHIIPTTHNCLVPVSRSKTVLNVSTYLNKDSTRDENIRKLMLKIGCPLLNEEILKSSVSPNPTGATAVRRDLLAMVQSTEDVLGLLSQTLSGAEKVYEGTPLEGQEIEDLLVFLQSGRPGLNSRLLRNLRFYKTINGTFTQLSDELEVFEVPADVPQNGLQVLSTKTNSIFLCQADKLPDLYQYVGIKRVSAAEFYKDIVLKNFDHLTPEEKEHHLKFVRDHLLHINPEALLSNLKGICFLSNRSGELCPASKFYDPGNEIFQQFVPKEKFPPKPYDTIEWKEFLRKVGLQCDITKELFKQFAKQLEGESKSNHNPSPEEAKRILEKSNILVAHLLGDKSLHTKPFLSQVSEIHFVPRGKVEQMYLDIRASYTRSILTCFKGSVTEEHVDLVWSSAPLIAEIAVPHPRDHLVVELGIFSEVPRDLVVKHVKNISELYPLNAEKKVPSELQEITKKIYRYFNELLKSGSKKQREECVLAIRKFPVILVNEYAFVRGNQLAFDGVWDDLKPYMFKIPRHLGGFERLLKCLGAQERPTPLQCSLVLATINESCGDRKMREERRAAVGAAICLFKQLSEDEKRKDKNFKDKTRKEQKHQQQHGDSVLDIPQSLVNVSVLYLPTEGGVLRPSCKVFFNDTMQTQDRLGDYRFKLLVDLTIKNAEPLEKLVKLLPDRLKVKMLSSVIEDGLSESDCEDCIHRNCDFIKPYRDLLFSRELSDAMIRLYKWQERIDKIPPKVMEDLRSLGSGVEIICMKTIKVQFVKKETGKPVPDSKSEVPTFCQKRPDGYCILIEHGGGSNSALLHERLASFVSMITGQHIKDDQWRYLIFIIMLGFKFPSEISNTLDVAGIPQIRFGQASPAVSVTEPPNSDEADRWMRQAQKDFDAATCLYESGHYSPSCFFCQQATEKALKALMFAKGRLMSSDLENHDVTGLAYRASEIDESLRSIPTIVECFQRYYIKTRYPDYKSGVRQQSIPAENFDRRNTEDAMSKTDQILSLIQGVLN